MKVAVVICFLGAFLGATSAQLWDTGYYGVRSGLGYGYGGLVGGYGGIVGGFRDSLGLYGGVGNQFNSDIRNLGGSHQTVNEIGGIIQDKFGHSIGGPAVSPLGRANTDIANDGGNHQTVNRIGGILTV